MNSAGWYQWLLSVCGDIEESLMNQRFRLFIRQEEIWNSLQAKWDWGEISTAADHGDSVHKLAWVLSSPIKRKSRLKGSRKTRAMKRDSWISQYSITSIALLSFAPTIQSHSEHQLHYSWRHHGESRHDETLLKKLSAINLRRHYLRQLTQVLGHLQLEDHSCDSRLKV